MFLKTDINHVQAKEILKLLKTHSCFSQLHSDPRTIMHTPRTSCHIDNIAGGQYHIEGESCIARLSLDLVKQSVFDYMHLVCLGVMEKLFLAIIDGKYASSAKLPPISIKTLSAILEIAKKFCPKEFARKPINATKHRTFKATEHRQILLYTGPVIFYGLINEAMYLHSLLLHSAIRILVDVVSCKNAVAINKAEIMLKIFVQRASEHYGIEFLSYNVHGLLHLANDVKNYGLLDSFSAFPYENNMNYFRRICRKPNQHLQQIANRRYEEKSLQNILVPTANFIQVSGLHKHGPVPEIRFHHYSQYRNLLCKQFTLSLNGRDDTIILKDSSICILQNIIGHDNKYYLVVKCFQKIESFFHTLVQSSSVGIFHCSSLSDELIIINFDQIAGKCFKLPLCDIICTASSDDYVIAKILSSFD